MSGVESGTVLWYIDDDQKANHTGYLRISLLHNFFCLKVV